MEWKQRDGPFVGKQRDGPFVSVPLFPGCHNQEQRDRYKRTVPRDVPIKNFLP